MLSYKFPKLISEHFHKNNIKAFSPHAIILLIPTTLIFSWLYIDIVKEKINVDHPWD